MPDDQRTNLAGTIATLFGEVMRWCVVRDCVFSGFIF